MVEEKITFQSDTIQIEGLLCVQDGKRGAVITHPHPGYGGSMYTMVVEILTTIYQEKGFSTLRFNFRGVGLSEGHYNQGDGEKEDVRSALHYLRDKGKSDLDLAGYSFGAWVNAKIIDSEPSIKRVIMVSPPVAFLEFPPSMQSPKIQVVVTGDRDEFAPAHPMKDLIIRWNPEARLEIIEGADHFYLGKSEALHSVLSRAIG
jgi:uncharacterized protein